MEYKKGQTWNESSVYQDPITLRKVRRLTSAGIANGVPSYHTDQSFTRDGKYVILITYRFGRTALLKANLETGDLTCLIEPFEGMGSPHEVHQYGDGRGTSCGGAVLAPQSHWAYYAAGKSLRAVHIDTLEEKTLVEDVPQEYFIESMSVSCDEKYLLYALGGLYPKNTEQMCYELHRVHLADGTDEVLIKGCGFNLSHLQQNPVYPHLFMLGKELGPSSDNKIDDNSRCWIWNTETGEMINVGTVAKQNFQTHTAWTWDGKGIVYHGVLADTRWPGNLNENGWYIGLAGLDGKPIREYAFPKAPYYGHVSAMKGRNAAIIDGNIMDGFLLWLDFDNELPKVEVIARHDTDFTLAPCQWSHPHAICAPDGKHLVFNSARRVIFAGGRSDVYSVEV